MMNRKLKIKVTLDWFENKNFTNPSVPPQWSCKDTEYLLFEVDDDAWNYGTLEALAFRKVQEWVAKHSGQEVKYEIRYRNDYSRNPYPNEWYEIVWNHAEHSLQEEIDGCMSEVTYGHEEQEKAYKVVYQ